MAATFTFNEYNGNMQGSAGYYGTTLQTNITTCNWKNIDDATTAYTAAPITAGNNSFTKYIYGRMQGSYKKIQAGLFAHTAGTLGTGLTVMGLVDSYYSTPSAATNSNLTVDMTAPIAITSGQTVKFSKTSPYDLGCAVSQSNGTDCYTQYLITQLQTTTSAAAGDTATVTLTLRYDEN